MKISIHNFFLLKKLYRFENIEKAGEIITGGELCPGWLID